MRRSRPSCWLSFVNFGFSAVDLVAERSMLIGAILLSALVRSRLGYLPMLTNPLWRDVRSLSLQCSDSYSRCPNGFTVINWGLFVWCENLKLCNFWVFVKIGGEKFIGTNLSGCGACFDINFSFEIGGLSVYLSKSGELKWYSPLSEIKSFY
jgi:hypothetical protein